MAVIELNHVTKDYGYNRGVFDVTFSVDKGEVYGFLGPNGAGKTTTIRHIMGFSKPQKGTTQVNGLNSWKYASEIQRNLGYLPGEINIPENLSGTQFIKLMAELRGMKDMTYTRELIEQFHFEPKGNVKRMSLGMKRKLAIVTAFMHDPDVLILDEPTNGLDPLMQNQFIQFIKHEKSRGKTILLSSHLFNEIEATCDKISIIKDGRLVSTFLVDEFRNSNVRTYKIELQSEEQFAHLREELKSIKQFAIQKVLVHKNQVIIKTTGAEINNLIQLLSKYDLKFFTEVKISLQDYFMKFYDKNTTKSSAPQ